MITHLVISDIRTLNRLLRQTDRLQLVADDSVPLGMWLNLRHKETGDRWMFRPPEAPVPSIDGIGFIFGPDLGVGNSLPLAAACDLLGVDEL